MFKTSLNGSSQFIPPKTTPNKIENDNNDFDTPKRQLFEKFQNEKIQIAKEIQHIRSPSENIESPEPRIKMG